MYIWTVPVYYVPMAALATGQGKVLKQNEDGAGFWTGSIVSGDQTAEATGYENGPLKDLVKIKATDAGLFTSNLSIYLSACLPPYTPIITAQEVTFSPD